MSAPVTPEQEAAQRVRALLAARARRNPDHNWLAWEVDSDHEEHLLLEADLELLVTAVLR